MFACEFYEIFKNTFFTEYRRTTSSGDKDWKPFQIGKYLQAERKLKIEST